MFNNELTIVTYHYVRELEKTSYPSIKGLHLEKFKKQLEYFQRVYTFISIQDIFNNLNYNEAIPANALLLTFDDGYTDHFINVFPILNKLGIKGCFFPSAKPVQENKVLSVNKIQFILASMKSVDDLLKNIYDSLDNNRHLYDLKSNDYYFNLLTRDLYGFDGKKITFIKRILQKELERKTLDLFIKGTALEKRSLVLQEKLFDKSLDDRLSSMEQELIKKTVGGKVINTKKPIEVFDTTEDVERGQPAPFEIDEIEIVKSEPVKKTESNQKKESFETTQRDDEETARIGRSGDPLKIKKVK